jgi:hypothetical protein
MAATEHEDATQSEFRKHWPLDRYDVRRVGGLRMTTVACWRLLPPNPRPDITIAAMTINGYSVDPNNEAGVV